MPLDDLVRRVRDREPRSLQTLMQEHGPHVYNLALRITGSDADALYVVKEVFVHLPEALDGFDGDDFRAWLTRFSAHRAYRHVHSRNSDAGSSAGESATEDWPPAADFAVTERHSAARTHIADDVARRRRDHEPTPGTS